MRGQRAARPAVIRVAAYAGVLAVTLFGGLAAAAAQRPWLVVTAAALTAAVELALRLSAVDVADLLARAGAGLPIRAALGAVTLVLLAARGLPRSVLIGTAVVAALIVLGAVGFAGLRRVVERIARPPLVTRNLDLAIAPPPQPPRLLTEPPSPAVLAVLVAAIGLAIDHHRGHSFSYARPLSGPVLWRLGGPPGHVVAASVGLAIATVLALLPASVLAGHIARLWRTGARAKLNDAAVRAVARLEPEVVLYFAATAGEVYQVDQWLRAVERLGRPAAVMVRSEAVMAALAPTSLPVICSQYNGTIAALPLRDRVVVLFPTHSGNNLSIIRRPETRTVFVGHGDSDKPDSINPFARVYDEVWVAGPLGRRRYAEAGLGVADAAIVEIGRPQIDVPDAPPPARPVIVYAPTWEGWGDDEHHSSLPHLGAQLIRGLQAHEGVTVRYRPHPLTGVRSTALRAADAEIAALVGRVPSDEPIAVTFAGASGVVADVSSVIPEFLPYDRPYAVPDTRGLGRSEFVARFPSVAAGFVITPDLTGLDDFVAAVTGGSDPTAAARTALLLDVLGDPATSQQRFAAAVERLLNR